MAHQTVTQGTKGPIRRWSYSEEEYHEASNDSMGLCLGCGAENYSCEPDARKYECEDCGQARVYGLEELVLMGRVTVDGDREEE
jgi:hypothetical protein